MSVVNPNEPRYGGWIGTLPSRRGVEIVRVADMEGVEEEAQESSRSVMKTAEVSKTNQGCS